MHTKHIPAVEQQGMANVVRLDNIPNIMNRANEAYKQGSIAEHHRLTTLVDLSWWGALWKK